MLFKSSDRKAALCSHELFLEENICFVESLRAAVSRGHHHRGLVSHFPSQDFFPYAQPSEAKSGVFCSVKIRLPEREQEREGSLLPERPVKSSSLHRA